MKSLISNGIFKPITPSVSKLICFIALIFTTMTFQSCDKGNASLEAYVSVQGYDFSNYSLTLKSDSHTYTVSSNQDGIALFTDLSSGSYIMSWNGESVRLPNGNTIILKPGTKDINISRGQAATLTLTF